VTLAVVTSPSWKALSHPANDLMLRRLSVITTTLIYVQILIGATMRHVGAGMAIPTFPLAFGHVVPPVWTGAIAVHFAHRAGALVVLSAVFATAAHVWYWQRERPEFMRPAMLLVLFVCVQATLGAFVVMSALQPVINTAHVVNGALVLATSLVLTLRVYRHGMQAPFEGRIAAQRPVLEKHLREVRG
jgi:cytochrome c oxidase assembly protein subunit 15